MELLKHAIFYEPVSRLEVGSMSSWPVASYLKSTHAFCNGVEGWERLIVLNLTSLCLSFKTGPLKTGGPQLAEAMRPWERGFGFSTHS